MIFNRLIKQLISKLRDDPSKYKRWRYAADGITKIPVKGEDN